MVVDAPTGEEKKNIQCPIIISLHNSESLTFLLTFYSILISSFLRLANGYELFFL